MNVAMCLMSAMCCRNDLRLSPCNVPTWPTSPEARCPPRPLKSIAEAWYMFAGQVLSGLSGERWFVTSSFAPTIRLPYRFS